MKLGNSIGQFISLDEASPSSLWVKQFLRIKVLIHNKQPLKAGIFIKHEDGCRLWVQFRYERLSDFCFCCGKLGHG